jgi:hypothetical protein
MFARPNPEYRQSHSIELHQPMDEWVFAQPNLALDIVSHTQQNFPPLIYWQPTNPWVM